MLLQKRQNLSISHPIQFDDSIFKTGVAVHLSLFGDQWAVTEIILCERRSDLSMFILGKETCTLWFSWKWEFGVTLWYQRLFLGQWNCGKYSFPFYHTISRDSLIWKNTFKLILKVSDNQPSRTPFWGQWNCGKCLFPLHHTIHHDCLTWNYTFKLVLNVLDNQLCRRPFWGQWNFTKF